MGLLDGVMGQVVGSFLKGGDSGNQLVGQVLQLVQSQGGLAGLVQKFNAAGLSSQAASWVSTGKNMPVSADEIMKALGAGAVGGIGSKIGLSGQDAASALSQMLPQVVDKLTPKGAIEAGGGDLMGQLGSLAGAIFGNH